MVVNFLLSKDVKMIVMACNTATAMALEIVKEKLDIPVIGVILPGASSAIQKTKTNKIGVIATQASIRSDEYHKTIARKSSAVEVYSLACPKFVSIVESNEMESEIVIVRTLNLTEPLIKQNPETITNENVKVTILAPDAQEGTTIKYGTETLFVL